MGPGPKAVNEEISDQVSSNQELSESVDGSTKDEN
jgi:molecular chaperone GrpE